MTSIILQNNTPYLLEVMNCQKSLTAFSSPSIKLSHRPIKVKRAYDKVAQFDDCSPKKQKCVLGEVKNSNNLISTKNLALNSLKLKKQTNALRDAKLRLVPVRIVNKALVSEGVVNEICDRDSSDLVTSKLSRNCIVSDTGYINRKFDFKTYLGLKTYAGEIDKGYFVSDSYKLYSNPILLTGEKSENEVSNVVNIYPEKSIDQQISYSAPKLELNEIVRYCNDEFLVKNYPNDPRIRR